MKTKKPGAAASRYARVSQEEGHSPAMNVRFAGVGAEPKSVVILAALLIVAGYFFISNRFSASNASPGSSAPSSAAQASSSQKAPTREVLRVSRRGQQKTRAEDLK